MLAEHSERAHPRQPHLLCPQSGVQGHGAVEIGAGGQDDSGRPTPGDPGAGSSLSPIPARLRGLEAHKGQQGAPDPAERGQTDEKGCRGQEGARNPGKQGVGLGLLGRGSEVPGVTQGEIPKLKQPPQQLALRS